MDLNICEWQISNWILKDSDWITTRNQNSSIPMFFLNKGIISRNKKAGPG